jgi:hypothetical protein
MYCSIPYEFNKISAGADVPEGRMFAIHISCDVANLR